MNNEALERAQEILHGALAGPNLVGFPEARWERAGEVLRQIVPVLSSGPTRAPVLLPDGGTLEPFGCGQHLYTGPSGSVVIPASLAEIVLKATEQAS